MKVLRYKQTEFGTPGAAVPEPLKIDLDEGGKVGAVLDGIYSKRGHVEMMNASSDFEDAIRDYEGIPFGPQLGKAPANSHRLQGTEQTCIQASEVWFDKTAKTGRKRIPGWLQPDWDNTILKRRDTFLDRAAGRQQEYDDAIESDALTKSLNSYVHRAYDNPEQAFDQLGFYDLAVDKLARPDGALLKLDARDRMISAAVDGYVRKDPEQAKKWLKASKRKKDSSGELILPYKVYKYGIDKADAEIDRRARAKIALEKAVVAADKAKEQAKVAEYKLNSQGLDAFQKANLNNDVLEDLELSDSSKSSLLTFIDKGPRLYSDGVKAKIIDDDLEGHDLRYVEDLHTKREITDFEYTRLKAYYDHIQTDPAYKDQCGIAAGLVDDETFGPIETALDKVKATNTKRRISADIAKAMAAGYEPEQARLEALREVKRTKAHVRDWRWDKPYEPGELKKEVVKRGKEYSLSIAEIGKEDTALYNEILDELLAEFNNYPEVLRGTLKGNVRERLILIKLVEMRLPGTAENRERAWREVQEDLK